MEALKWLAIFILSVFSGYVLLRVLGYGVFRSYFEAKMQFIAMLKKHKEEGKK
jgi:hypothetical protein